jgi:hypothetical protein
MRPCDRPRRGGVPSARGVRHDPSVPDRVEQLVFAHYAVAVSHEVYQQVVNLRFHMNDLTGTAQLLTMQVDAVPGEDIVRLARSV